MYGIIEIFNEFFHNLSLIRKLMTLKESFNN